jgi:hypothetical protein
VTGVRLPDPLQLAPVGPASSHARAYIRTGLRSLGRDSLVDSAQLGVTEMVTNACLHARTPMVVALRLVTPDIVRIEVTDSSPRSPELRPPDAMATTGRGLRLLMSFGRWGVDPLTPPDIGKTVWFEPWAEPVAGFGWNLDEPEEWVGA